MTAAARCSGAASCSPPCKYCKPATARQGLIGSWAGAMGQTQFMPTTFNQHAVDFDGDGRRDLWSSTPDALASAAHYLQASGWENGQPWGFEVDLPQASTTPLPTRGAPHLSQWRELGVNPLSAIDADEQSLATLFLPAGHRGPAFLLLNNFRSILKYNNSTAYALAIGLLRDALDGKSGVQAAWPRSDRQLGRSERIELQELLASKGYEPGPADGIIGANTRKRGARIPAEPRASRGRLPQLSAAATAAISAHCDAAHLSRIALHHGLHGQLLVINCAAATSRLVPRSL